MQSAQTTITSTQAVLLRDLIKEFTASATRLTSASINASKRRRPLMEARAKLLFDRAAVLTSIIETIPSAMLGTPDRVVDGMCVLEDTDRPYLAPADGGDAISPKQTDPPLDRQQKDRPEKLIWEYQRDRPEEPIREYRREEYRRGEMPPADYRKHYEGEPWWRAWVEGWLLE